MGKIKFNKKQEKEICELYLEGQTTVELGKRFKCSNKTIWNRLIQNGIQRRLAKRRYKLDYKQQKEICRLYLEGYTTRELGEEFNCGGVTIWKTLKQNKIPRRNAGTEIHKPLNLSENIKNFLIGDILSDANMTKPQGNGNSLLNWGLKHKGYAEYLRNIYNSYFKINPPKFYRSYSKKRKKWYSRWEIRSENNSTFTALRAKWYSKGKKIVPKDTTLTPKTSLHWYLGDGYLNKKNSSIKLATNGFIKKEVEFLIIRLKEIGVKTTKNKTGKKGQFIIRISRIESRKFLDYIGPCPVECYDYKWFWKDTKRNINNKELQLVSA